ncbi:porin family protein [uncultured Proteiniphilum sp.]|uniref:porin family protein n=1 Tax=uncultured Proteiniphilum sp. TaxID=497637 RepID=UPI002601E601|nr:porin family protein [uncultured Proteiniphilum sp.]
MTRKSIFVLLLLSVMGFSVRAQFKASLKAGPDMSNMSMTLNGVETDIFSPRIGFHTGLAAEYMFSRRFGLESGLNYSRLGATINPDRYYQGSELPEGFSMEGHVSMQTLELPLYAKLKFRLFPGMQFFLAGGAFGSYSLKAEQYVKHSWEGDYIKMKWSLFEPEIQVMGETEDNVLMLQRFNVGIALESGVEIGNQLTAGIGFRQMLNNMAAFGYSVNGQTAKPDITMWTLSFSLGYLL